MFLSTAYFGFFPTIFQDRRMEVYLWLVQQSQLLQWNAKLMRNWVYLWRAF